MRDPPAHAAGRWWRRTPGGRRRNCGSSVAPRSRQVIDRGQPAPRNARHSDETHGNSGRSGRSEELTAPLALASNAARRRVEGGERARWHCVLGRCRVGDSWSIAASSSARIVLCAVSYAANRPRGRARRPAYPALSRAVRTQRSPSDSWSRISCPTRGSQGQALVNLGVVGRAALPVASWTADAKSPVFTGSSSTSPRSWPVTMRWDPRRDVAPVRGH